MVAAGQPGGCRGKGRGHPRRRGRAGASRCGSSRVIWVSTPAGWSSATARWARCARWSGRGCPAARVLQWDKDDCADVGLVKFDLLGLGMLAALHDCLDLVDEHYGEQWDLEDDPARGRASTRCCQAADRWASSRSSRGAQMATLPRLRPEKFYDLVVEVALIRPGPIQGGSVHPYLRRRAGTEVTATCTSHA